MNTLTVRGLAAVMATAALLGACSRSDDDAATAETTGAPTSADDVRAAGDAGLPVVVGSGTTVDNVDSFGDGAAAFIIGSALKEAGDWRAPVDLDRVKAMRDAIDDDRRA